MYVYLKKRILKKVATCHSNKTGINNIRETHTGKYQNSHRPGSEAEASVHPYPHWKKLFSPLPLLPVWLRGVGRTRKEARSLFQALPNLQTLLSAGPLKGWGPA